MAAVQVAELNTERPPDLIESLTSILIARGLASLPDKLEPATNPHHRQFFHSWLAAGGVAYLFRCLHRWDPVEPYKRIIRLIGKAACVAYLAHLALDSLTPRSLPLIGRVT